MYLPIDDRSMLTWLRTQIRVMEAWREELAIRPEIDVDQAMKIETHLSWLSAEYDRLTQNEKAAA